MFKIVRINKAGWHATLFHTVNPHFDAVAGDYPAFSIPSSEPDCDLDDTRRDG